MRNWEGARELGIVDDQFCKPAARGIVAHAGGYARTLPGAMLVPGAALGVETLRKVGGPRSKEWLCVGKHMPGTNAWWDNSQHFCRGSESLVSEIRPQLAELGWMQPLSSLQAAEQLLTSD